MKTKSPLILCIVIFAGCAPFKATQKYHTAAITAPSVAPVKESIGAAAKASAETSRNIKTIDYKASRALQFFP